MNTLINFSNKALESQQLNGYTFKKWSDVKDIVRKERREIERKRKKSDGVFKFHYHGLVLMVDDERTDFVAHDKISFRNLKHIVENALMSFPNKKIEISIEGHYDWWASYQDLFQGVEYEPTDDYIDVLLYENNKR